MKNNANCNESPILVLDIGGTNFRYALYSPRDGQLSSIQREAIPNFINTTYSDIKELQSQLIDKIVQLVVDTKKNTPSLTRVGISFPSAMTPQGVAYFAPTLWGPEGKNFPIFQVLSQRMPEIQWVIENDITAATERYVDLYSQSNCDYLGVFTVSSGVGNKIYDIRSKRILLNHTGFGGEIGHATLSFSDTAPLCDCGARGHLGAFSSGRAIEKYIRDYSQSHPEEYTTSILSTLVSQPSGITSSIFVKAIHMEDQFSLRLLDVTTQYLSIVFSVFYHGIGVDKFIIIGGFANACGEHFKKSLIENMRKIGFMAKTNEEMELLVDLGIDDGNDCLYGIGMLAADR